MKCMYVYLRSKPLLYPFCQLADVVQQSEAQSSLGGKVEELETALQVWMDGVTGCIDGS